MMHFSSQAELLEAEERYCSHGDTIHYNQPVQIFEKAEGPHLIDPDGNRYLDFQMMYSAANFGYRNPHFIAAAKAQLDTLPQLASEYICWQKIELSAHLCKSAEEAWGGSGRVHFNVGGAQAVDDALKLVASNKGTRRVFAFEGSYHGRTIGASAITSSYRYRRTFGDFSSRAQFLPYPYCFRCPYGKSRDTCELYCVSQISRLFESEYQSVLDTRTHTPEFAAFFVEPVQGTGGYIVPPEGYFEALKKILDEFNILLAVDEIQMGFYRTGKMWAIEHFKVAPDILVFGKALTNGMNPLSGLWAREELISPEQFPPGSTHSTFSNNPMGMALGCATFELLASFDALTSIGARGRYLQEGLQEIQTRHPEIGDVDGLGLAVRVEICHADGITPNRDLAHRVHDLALSRGVVTKDGPMRLILDIGGHYKNVFTLAPPLDVSKGNIEQFLQILEENLVFAKAQL